MAAEPFKKLWARWISRYILMILFEYCSRKNCQVCARLFLLGKVMNNSFIVFIPKTNHPVNFDGFDL